MHRTVSGAIATPAAGADIVWTPSTTERVKLLAITAKLVTNGTAGNRAPILSLLDLSGNTVLEVTPGGTQAASLTGQFSWYESDGPRAGTNAQVGGVASADLPSFWLPEGWSVKTTTVNIQTGDQWSGVYGTFLVYDEAMEKAWRYIEELALASQ